MSTDVTVSDVAGPPPIAEIAAALSKAQAMFGPIPRSRTVSVKMKAKPDGREGGTYTFSYAPLDVVLEAVRPALAANGLAITQVMAGGGNALRMRTMLLHSSGQFIASDVPVVAEGGGPQALGSAITYMRRYVITALLGLASEEDDDGNHASGNTTQPVQRAARKAPAPPQAPTEVTAKQRANFAKAMQSPNFTADEKDAYSVAEAKITDYAEYGAMLLDLSAEAQKRVAADPGASA